MVLLKGGESFKTDLEIRVFFFVVFFGSFGWKLKRDFFLNVFFIGCLSFFYEVCFV